MLDQAIARLMAGQQGLQLAEYVHVGSGIAGVRNGRAGNRDRCAHDTPALDLTGEGVAPAPDRPDREVQVHVLRLAPQPAHHHVGAAHRVTAGLGSGAKASLRGRRLSMAEVSLSRNSRSAWVSGRRSPRGLTRVQAASWNCQRPAAAPADAGCARVSASAWRRPEGGVRRTRACSAAAISAVATSGWKRRRRRSAARGCGFLANRRWRWRRCPPWCPWRAGRRRPCTDRSAPLP